MTQSASKSIDDTQSPAQVEVKVVTDIGALNYVWPIIEPKIKKGLRHGQGDAITAGALYEAVIGGEMQLWVMSKGEEILAGAFIAVVRHPAGKKVHVQMVAGKDLDKWGEKISDCLIQYMDEVGAICVETSARFGLEKMLQGLGWKRKSVVMELR